MTETKVKRKDIQHYLNITPESPAILGSLTATYALIGAGVPSAKIAMNAETTEEQYIAEDVSRQSVDSYGPTLPLEQTAKLGDPVFEFIDQLYLDRAVGADAETTLVEVSNYLIGGPTAAPAKEYKVAISIENNLGDAGVPIKRSFTINFVGSPVAGTFNITTPAFTAS